MLSRDDIAPDTWKKTGVFSVCETVAEVIVALHQLEGLSAVEQMLTDTKADHSRESLRQIANELARVGLKPLAALVRQHARRAKPEPPNFKTRWLNHQKRR